VKPVRPRQQSGDALAQCNVRKKSDHRRRGKSMPRLEPLALRIEAEIAGEF
jgi:hypothetical protein